MKEVLSLKLRASNSSGVQLLSFYKQDDVVYPCLHGEFNGERIQIDFDELDERVRLGLDIYTKKNDWEIAA